MQSFLADGWVGGGGGWGEWAGKRNDLKKSGQELRKFLEEQLKFSHIHKALGMHVYAKKEEKLLAKES